MRVLPKTLGDKIAVVATLGTLALSCGGRATNTLSSEDGGGTGGSPLVEADPAPAAGGGELPRVVPPPPDPIEPVGCDISEDGDLMWQEKVDDPEDYRSQSATYSWYEPDGDRNGGDPGVQDGGRCPLEACDTFSYRTWVSGVRLCGFSDWRLPTVDELLSRAEGEGEMLTGAEPLHWSSEPTDDPEAAWGVYLCCGGIPAPSVKSGEGFVLLVRDVR